MKDGWIKLHRKIENHWIFDNAEYLKAWITIILECNHKDNKSLIKGELLDCKRGQSLNSLKTWASLFGTRGWSMQVTRSYFTLLQKDGMIKAEGLKYTTRLTVMNYDSYQCEQQADNKLITSCQHSDNNKQERKNIYTRDFEELWKRYPEKDGKKQAKKHFIASVKSEKELNNINIALSNYLNSNKVRNGFIKNGSTWFNNWQDWIEYKEPEKERTLVF